MKTHVIQLDRHDDTTSIIDKINGSKASRILLIWPRRGRVVSRMLDLLLIQRASQNIGAQLACVADDDDILDHAQELGIPVFRSSRVAEKIPWRRTRLKKGLDPHPIHPLSYFQDAKSWLRPKANPWIHQKYLRWGVFALGMIAVLGLISFLLPGATVHLALAVELQSLEMPVWASPDLQGINLSGGIPARVIHTLAEGQASIKTSGRINLPDRSASGQVRFKNLTDQSVFIPAGSVVQTSREPAIQFRTLQDKTLDARPGAQIEVEVQAVKAGSQGNVRNGEIQAVIGSLGTMVSVINNDAMIGGSDVSSPAAAESDLNRLREQILRDLEEIALQELEKAKTSHQRLLLQTVQLVKIQEETVEPAIGLPADQIQMSLRADFQALTFLETDLARIGQSALDATINKDTNPLPGSFAIQDIQQPSVENGQVRWKIKASQLVQTTWVHSQLIRATAGQPVAIALKNLTELPGITEPPQILLSPAWWPILPILPARIELVIR